MDSPYGAGIDPIPYIAFAYALGLVLLFGYGFMCFLKHGKLIEMRKALGTKTSDLKGDASN